MTNWYIGATVPEDHGKTITAYLSMYEGDADFAKKEAEDFCMHLAIREGAAGFLDKFVELVHAARTFAQEDLSRLTYEEPIFAYHLDGATAIVVMNAEFIDEERFLKEFNEEKGTSNVEFKWNATDHRECQKLDHCIHHD